MYEPQRDTVPQLHKFLQVLATLRGLGERQSGMLTEVPEKTMPFAAGAFDNVGKLAEVTAGAAPPTPPRDVARTTWLGGKAVPLFR